MWVKIPKFYGQRCTELEFLLSGEKCPGATQGTSWGYASVFKIYVFGAEELARWIKRLPCKHENLNLDPQTDTKPSVDVQLSS